MKCNLLVLTVFLFLSFTLAQDADDDLIDISKIDMFPQQYEHRIYSGYLRISFPDKKFHYMYAQSQHDPANDPLILWLNGGPGCSSMLGFLYENGPFVFQQNTTKLVINPHAWNLKANVLYIESPASVGFSTYGGEHDLNYNDTSTAQDNLYALHVFFDKFPSLKKNDFYITGESYAGIYVPTLALKILKNNEDAEFYRINLRGIMVGNACTHPDECYNHKYYSKYVYKYLYEKGWIDEDIYATYRSACLMNWESETCLAQQKALYDLFRSTGADIYNIYGKCFNQTYPPKMQLYEANLENKRGLKNTLRCTDSIGSLVLFNYNEYREPLHINVDNETLQWSTCSEVLNYTMNPEASYYAYPILMKAGVKVMVYSGDADAIVPITGTVAWIKQIFQEMKLPFKKPWRPWVSHTQNISGMVWELEGISLVTFLGAGHMVPTNKPEQAYTMLDNFVNDLDFKWPNDYLIAK